jgi:hypothetical protein
MFKFWQYHGPVWNAAGEGGAGAGDPPAGEGSEGAGEGAPAPGAAPGSSILDFATPPGTPKAEGEGDAWKLPDGMELPTHLVGLSADETLQKVSKAYHGARTALSQKGKGEGKLEGSVPDTFDGYLFEADGDEDNIATELNSEASKPYVDAFRKAAHKLGIPDKAFGQLMREGLGGIAESGIPIGVSNEQAQQISGENEMATLVKEVGQLEAGTIVNTITTYKEKLKQDGTLTNEADEAEFLQMVGTAHGARIFHRILTGALGEKPIPPADGADGSVTKDEAYARHNAASSMKPGAERDQALASANKLFEKAYGNSASPTGSVRSSVL